MTTKDRKIQTRERQNPTHPLPPLNVDVLYGFDASLNAFDIRWDSPTQLGPNQKWNLLGVNIYRSNDSEHGPYYRLNDEPLGSTFYRDQTINEEIIDEDVTGRFLASGEDDEGGRWIFRTENYPIVRSDSEAIPAEHPLDVTVKIDGVEVMPAAVYGETGEVELRTDKIHDPATNTLQDALLPNPESVVTCTYHYFLSVATNELHRKVFYRVTTVGYREWDGEWDGEEDDPEVDDGSGTLQPVEGDWEFDEDLQKWIQLRETPLAWCEAKTVHHLENMDYIWREAIRRNSWILDQGGERVFLFIRKWSGERCEKCWDVDAQHPRVSLDCGICYGTGIEGGYEGPYDIKVAPPDVEKRIQIDEHGWHLEEDYEVWTGPSPMISQRDFIVKQNNDRYSIGPVRMPTNRGNVLQQHFSVNHLDENDVRYTVPVITSHLDYPETRTIGWEDEPVHKEGEPTPPVVNPQITEDETVPDGVEPRGRTVTYENINSKE